MNNNKKPSFFTKKKKTSQLGQILLSLLFWQYSISIKYIYVFSGRDKRVREGDLKKFRRMTMTDGKKVKTHDDEDVI